MIFKYFIIGSIIAFGLCVMLTPSDNKPAKTADDFIAEKIANGQELNWLEKKVLRDEREQWRKQHPNR